MMSENHEAPGIMLCPPTY